MMKLRAVGSRTDGFAMAALLVSMTIMAIAMSVALPVWHTAARREKEAELIFRGQQYARAVALYQRKFPGAAAPNLDVLLNEHLLRKKYKDPITDGDFQLVGAADAIALQGPGGGTAPGLATPGSPPRPGTSTMSQVGAGGQPPTGGAQAGSAISSAFGRPAASAPGTAAGGIIGVVSKSTDTSLRLYNGRNKYNEWVFVATQSSARAGGPGGGAPGGRGGQPQPGQGPDGVPGRNGFPQRGGFPPGGRSGFPPQGGGQRGLGGFDNPQSPGAGRRSF